ncbi:uncharacterized protein K489DRAFT_179795 [Dissoconium aciculare CBS 342.82]|uniref:Uncharacterized protein n=1 Tax=Dissoconium aciculare CBS 342.82 TaxID=1314786 RepID=A0A6J3M8K5_9PEZI|nr:uncharacterized protein K489DRAFT_179795 [Dissoconium aciculare CBS 342.82]KAF1824325.1 hypothetical protein K489DRAFT_179795 [Dissoconium aciculare CBS 342.82]
MATDENMTDVVSSGPSTSVFGPSLDEAQKDERVTQDTGMSEVTQAGLRTNPISNRVTSCDLSPSPRQGFPTVRAKTPCTEDNAKEGAQSQHPKQKPVDDEHSEHHTFSQGEFKVPSITSTVTIRAQTPQSNSQDGAKSRKTPTTPSSREGEFHTPRSTSSKNKTGPASNKPPSAEDDDLIFVGSSQKSSPAKTPVRPASAMSARFGTGMPSRRSSQSVLQDEALRTPSKVPMKRPASAQLESETSKKQKAPVSEDAMRTIPNTVERKKSLQAQVSRDRAYSGTAERNPSAGEDNYEYEEDEEATMLVSVPRNFAKAAHRQNEKQKQRVHAMAAEIQRLNETIQKKDGSIEEKNEDVAELEARAHRAEHDCMAMGTRLAQYREIDAAFYDRFEKNWETRTRAHLEARNAKEMKRMEERLDREGERLQARAERTLKEAREIREKSKEMVRDMKAKCDARVKDSKPQLNQIINKKDRDLQEELEKRTKLEELANGLYNSRQQYKLEKRDLEKELFVMREKRQEIEAENRDLKRTLATSKQNLTATNEVVGLQLIKTHNAETEIAELKKLLKAVNTELDDLRTEHEEAIEQSDRLQDELDELKEELRSHKEIAKEGPDSSLHDSNKDLSASHPVANEKLPAPLPIVNKEPLPSLSNVNRFPHYRSASNTDQDAATAQEPLAKEPIIEYRIPEIEARKQLNEEGQDAMRAGSPKAD